MNEYTACDLIQSNKPSQTVIYDNRLCPVLTVSSSVSFNLNEYGDKLYIASFSSDREKDSGKQDKIRKKTIFHHFIVIFFMFALHTISGFTKTI